MSRRTVPGSARVSTRALVDIVRPAVVGSYGVTGLAARTFGERLLGWLRLMEPGIRVSLSDGIRIDLHLTVAFGLPVAEVARQAESAVRYAVRTAVGREVERLTIHVGGMRYGTAEPPTGATPAEAASGSGGHGGEAHANGFAPLETLAVVEDGGGRRGRKASRKDRA